VNWARPSLVRRPLRKESIKGQVPRGREGDVEGGIQCKFYKNGKEQGSTPTTRLVDRLLEKVRGEKEKK